MEIDVDKTSLWVSYFTNDNVGDKLVAHYEKTMLLLNNLTIKKYSPINHLLVILVAFSSATYPEPEKLRYLKAKNEIEIRINIDYEKLKNATEAETLQLIAEAYLAAISRFLSKRKDFDAKNFYIDVEKLFRENHFLA